MRAMGITRVRTSAITRATETAAIVAQELGVAVLADERLNELRMGPWEGLTEDQIGRRYPDQYRQWLERPQELRLDGRETLHQLAGRVTEALEDSAQSGESELLITHVALVRVAILLGSGGPLNEYKQIPVSNCQYVRVPVWANGTNHRSRRAVEASSRRVTSQ